MPRLRAQMNQNPQRKEKRFFLPQAREKSFTKEKETTRHKVRALTLWGQPCTWFRAVKKWAQPIS